MNRYFISGTGTGVGKTHIASAMARVLSRRSPCVAIKPFETGVDDIAVDAERLLEASKAPILLPSLFRHAKPVAPFDAIWHDPAALSELLSAEHNTRDLVRNWSGDLIVEGAGGIAVPLRFEVENQSTKEPKVVTIADFARTLNLPLVLVVPNRLGVLSHTIAAAEFARARELHLEMVLLNDGTTTALSDASTATNQRTLEACLACPVHRVPKLSTGLDKSADIIETCGFL